MTGPIGLHGGGEYVDGDERFLDALLAAAERHRRRARGVVHVAGVLEQLEQAQQVVEAGSLELPRLRIEP
jgi:hypothetical protein